MAFAAAALPVSAQAAASLTRIVEVQGGGFVYEDADNGTAGVPLRVYYVPTAVHVARNPDGTPQWSFRTKPQSESEASFVLKLAPDANVVAGTDAIKADVAGRHGGNAADVKLLPLPLLDTKFATFAAGDDFVDPLLPADGTPAVGGFAFFLPMTAAGSHWFKHNVVEGGLQFAVFSGKAYLYDEFDKKLSPHEFRIPLYLHDVPYCAVVVNPCAF
jgi:hypothetical protein